MFPTARGITSRCIGSLCLSQCIIANVCVRALQQVSSHHTVLYVLIQSDCSSVLLIKYGTQIFLIFIVYKIHYRQALGLAAA